MKYFLAAGVRFPAAGFSLYHVIMYFVPGFSRQADSFKMGAEQWKGADSLDHLLGLSGDFRQSVGQHVEAGRSTKPAEAPEGGRNEDRGASPSISRETNKDLLSRFGTLFFLQSL